MPRSADYYNKILSQPSAVTPAASASSPSPTVSKPAIDQNAIDQNVAAINEKNEAIYNASEARRSLRSRLPYEVMNSFYNMPDELTWGQMSVFDKYKHLEKEGARETWRAIKALPATIAKAPLKIEAGLRDLTGRLVEKATGAPNIATKSYNLPILGEVHGAGVSYDEGRAMGLSPFMAAVKATGEFAGDAAVAFSLVDAIQGAFRPRVASVSEPVVKKDIRPMVAEKVAAKADDVAIPGKEVLSAKQKTNVEYLRLTNDAARQYGGNSGNTYLKVSPLGEGQAEYAVVQIRDSLANKSVDWMKNKFGRSKTTTGPYGPELKLDSGVVNYDQSLMARSEKPQAAVNGKMQNVPQEADPLIFGDESVIMEDLKNLVNKYDEGDNDISTIDDIVDEIENMDNVPTEIMDAVDKYRAEQEDDKSNWGMRGDQDQVEGKFMDVVNNFINTKKITETPDKVVLDKIPTEPVKPEVRSVMVKPLKGMGDEIITEKQYGQIRDVAEEVKLDDTALQAVSIALTGKANLNDLTQNEAFNVSEAVRSLMPTKTEETGWKYNVKSLTHPARYWMEAAEREFGVPIYSEVYMPIEMGMQSMKVYTSAWTNKAREIFGKYSGPKFAEERRLITSYIEGKKDAILKNKAIPENVKQDLVKIGDWLKDSYQAFFKKAGISSEKYFKVYAPNIRKMGGIYNLYKSGDLPLEIKPFYEFEREGMLDPVEDDALALFDVYTRAFSKKTFLHDALENAKRVVERAPENVRRAANDYLQEKLGYQDRLAEVMNNLGASISKLTNGKIPNDILKQVFDFTMTTSYAGALGLPRVMPILRNYIQPLITTYPEFGAEYLVRGFKWMAEKPSEATAEVRNKGFLVEMGVPYGAELVSEAGRGNLGRAAEIYKDFNQLMMKPYASSDVISRVWTYGSARVRFDENMALLKSGKINYDQFERNIDIQGFNPTLQKMIRQKLMQGEEEKAFDLMAMDIIDRTQFPYRKGTQSRLHYGLKGKLGLQFAQWAWEYTFTIKSWYTRGQYDKLVRWLGMGVAIKRSLEEAYNIDATKWVLAGPFTGFPIGPVGKMTMEFVGAVNNAFTNMSDDMNDNWKNIANAVKIYGGTLTGVGAQKLINFYKSVKRYEAGVAPSPYPDKPFGVYSTTGKLLYWTDFTGLMKQLLGFQLSDQADFSDRINKSQKDSKEYQMRVNEAMNALVDGKYEKFDKIITDNNLMIGDLTEKMKSYMIPLDQRLYQKLPIELKIKYYPMFFQQ